MADLPKRIQRQRTNGWKMPPNTVYVGRPTRWGNPFVVSSDPARLEHYGDYTKNVDLWDGWPQADSATAVEAFRAMKAVRLSADDLAVLRGKNLACWCPLDQPCHADVLLEFANKQPSNAALQRRGGRTRMSAALGSFLATAPSRDAAPVSGQVTRHRPLTVEQARDDVERNIDRAFFGRTDAEAAALWSASIGTIDALITAVRAEAEAEIQRLREELAVTDGLLTERQRVLDAIPPCPVHGACVPHGLAWIRARAGHCATCQHYSGESCADTRPHPMQHRVCEPTWGCPQWEAK